MKASVVKIPSMTPDRDFLLKFLVLHLLELEQHYIISTLISYEKKDYRLAHEWYHYKLGVAL